MAKASGASTKALRALALKHAEEEIALNKASLATAKNTYEKNKNTLASLINSGASDELIEKQREVTTEARKASAEERKDLEEAVKNKADIVRKNAVEVRQELTDNNTKIKDANKALNDAIKQQNEEAAKTEKDRIKTLNDSILSLREEIRVSKLNEEQKEKDEVEKKYTKLIEDAKKANINVSDLEKEKQNALKLIREKYDKVFELTQAEKDAKGKELPCTIQGTMMRIDLPTPLKSKQSFLMSIDWFNYINNTKIHGGRGGFEHFEIDGSDIFELAQWFPRLCVYDDVEGWQNKEYIGRGEFALEFGDYKVSITVPEDHIVAATGELQNANAVLTADMQSKLITAKSSKTPVLIFSQDEVEKKLLDFTALTIKSKKMKTWIFQGKNVRDFAWASSRKFIWDALGVNSGGKIVMCMSYYPKEGNPLWEKYSTHAVAQTILTYSKYTIQYPYPIAISVNGPIGGMEYPMICFNGPRPEADGTYSERTKTGLISVVIHEVGHNFFPMIINSDERQWTWMDEGLNTFVQFLTEKEWDKDYPSSRGEPRNIVQYMSSDKTTLCPIMTNSESILQFGNNAYGKPATALNILRETVMGRELFDFAFKTYCQRWAFRHPRPADFFRTMEDASAVDLDWFW
ncbi:MAG: hypothetical protein EBR24_05735, partial [Flavobacteriia bacterium]|nr:hypothetical protein [Flavobacteriia bacterium]